MKQSILIRGNDKNNPINELGFLGNPSHPAVVGSLERSSPRIRAFFNGIEDLTAMMRGILRSFQKNW
ncbi:hypothetical protein ASZ90_017944 [hydrocarbon metagenome]|uniref:Uncharacterized protein n=1 Tax=hydrocarbon metagenome TaxID=938273 RepID=A0A0W8E7G6_9ZZZZ